MPSTNQQKENDPSMGRLRRLSSITSITTPIGQIASKFRRPSTAVPPVKPTHVDTNQGKPTTTPMTSRQSSINSSHGQTKPSAIPRLQETSAPRWTSRQEETKLPKSQTMSNLFLLSRREPSYQRLPVSYSTTNLRSGRIPVPNGVVPSTNNSRTSREKTTFLTLRKTNNSALSSSRAQSKPTLSGLRTPFGSSFSRSLAGVQEATEDPPHPFSIPRKQIVSRPESDQSSAFGLSRDERLEVERLRTTIPKQDLEQRTSRKPVWISRKRIDEEYGTLRTPSKALARGTSEVGKSPRHSYGSDITHHQLMAPLSPPLPRTPAGYNCADTPPSLASARLVRQVTQAQPPSYWSGRYTSLNDRLLNEAMDTCSNILNGVVPDKTSKAQEELVRLAGSVHSEAHAQHILDLLYSACVTEEALRSLRIWQFSFGRLKHMPNLATYMPTSAFANLVTAARKNECESSILHSTSGNKYHRAAGGVYGELRRGREVSEESVASSEISAATAMKRQTVEALPPTGSGRKTSFIDRLVSSGRKISGKASSLGGSIFHTGESDHEGLIAR